MLIIHTPRAQEQDRTEAFRDFARRRAAGEVLAPPTLLPPEERRMYVRATLREDHRYSIDRRPEGAQAKFDKLAASPFVFFRGTSLLYYRDYAGTDAELPIVLAVGDMHPENFGVMPNEHGAPFFGVNDFDEACFAPFTYDVKRGAVGFHLLAKQLGLKKKRRRRVVEAWVRGYVDGLRAFAQDDRERWFQYRVDSSPPLIRDLLRSAMRERRAFLEGMVDLEKERFLSTDELVPCSNRREEFQAAVDEYRKHVNVALRDNPDGFFVVRDVALKKDSGTASAALERYFVLIEGPSNDPADDVILEMKQARRSALRFLSPAANRDGGGAEPAEQVVRAHDVHLVGGDAFYGRAELGGREFVVRERSPFKDEMKVDRLDADELEDYARICGQVLAQTHARSDEDTGAGPGEVETAILATIDPEVFVDDMARFAKEAADRVCADWEGFRADHELGAFNVFRGQE